MTVGKLFRTMVFTPLLIAVFAYPIYLGTVEGLDLFSYHSFLQMASVVISCVLLFAGFMTVLCYTICNCEEELKSWWSWENLKYYIEEGKSNKYKNRGY